MNFLKALILDDLIEFLDFWFYHFPKRIIRHFFDRIYVLDNDLKVKANLRNLSKPLYGDYTIIGRILALPYRLIKIFLGFVVYFMLLVFYLLFLLLWLTGPFFILSYGFLF
jgi:hypothetical protein